MIIDTTHLRLQPYAPEQLLALIEGVPQFEDQIGLRAADGLRDFIVSDEVSSAWLSRLRGSREPDPWIHGFAVIDRNSRSVIGNASFTGPPDEEGTVEIAYGIVPDYQGRGYATEAAAALVAFAFGSEHVRLVRAHTLPKPNASTRVLAKCGFERVGEVADPEGPVWRWELTREPA
jgi:ribosomal-protein-alanine N-acetyltransferase